MTRPDAEQVHPESVAEWSRWLAANHDRRTGVWFVSFKKRTGRQAVGYDDAVTEALRYGWVDSKGTTLDEEMRSMPCSMASCSASRGRSQA